MEKIKKFYEKALEGVGDLPSWKDDWRWILLYSIIIYAAVLAVRLSFAGRWDHPELWVNGERIMATHDAYFWLAKAKGVGQLAGYPLAQFAALLHELTGMKLGTIGFWMPAFMGALVGVVCYMWGWFLGGRTAGIFAGLAGAMTPGFYYRSRLGYFDSDMFTLLVPLLVALMLAYWASFHMKSGWFLSLSKDENQEDTPSIGKSFHMALAFGLATRIGGIWHQDIIYVTILYVFLAAVVVMINAKPGRRQPALLGLSIFILAAYPGGSHGFFGVWPLTLFIDELNMDVVVYKTIFGVLLAVLATVTFPKLYANKGSLLTKEWVGAGLLVSVILSTGISLEPIMSVFNKLYSYFAQAGESGLSGGKAVIGPIYPSIVQSIIEAKLIPLKDVLVRGIFFPWLGYLSLIGSVVVVVLRPVAIFLVPLVALQLLSMKLGVRFTMFGGAVLVIFFGVSVSWIVRSVVSNISYREKTGLGIQAIGGIALLVFSFNLYGHVPLTPVVPKQHAEALVQLSEQSSPDGMIWTWWDWGYASQYYAGMETVVDGGKHAGRDVYPVAFTMTTDSSAKARGMVLFSAQYPAPGLNLGLSPAVAWDSIPRSEIDATVQSQIEHSSYPMKQRQFFVVSWRDMALVKWISHFGNWNLETGTTKESSASSYEPGELGFNLERGAIRDRSGGGGLVSDITVLDWDSARTREYYMNKLSPQLLPRRRHLLINMVSKQSVIMDRMGYRSMMTRLLVGDPNDPEISRHFKLVVDKLPFARIYEVVQ